LSPTIPIVIVFIARASGTVYDIRLSGDSRTSFLTFYGRFWLEVTLRTANKLTIKYKANEAITDYLLNQYVNPLGPSNEVWASNIIYLKTTEDRMDLAAVADLFSRRIVRWHIDTCMTAYLIGDVLT